MSVARSLYKSMLQTTNVRNIRSFNNISKSKLYFHRYVYENESHSVVGPYEDRVKNLMSYIKFRIKYGDDVDIDNLFTIHNLLKDFIKMNENEKIGEYEYETEIQILDNY